MPVDWSEADQDDSPKIDIELYRKLIVGDYSSDDSPVRISKTNYDSILQVEVTRNTDRTYVCERIMQSYKNSIS